MPDEETSSDTLRDDLTRAQGMGEASVRSVAYDAVEYAAQLEAEVERWRDEAERLDHHIQEPVEQEECDECGATWQTIKECENCDVALELAQTAQAERDEARAERDLLFNALEEVKEPHVDTRGCAEEALREVEAGDTVDRIREGARREAFEEAAEEILHHCPDIDHPCEECQQRASAIRALAEGDDQEDDGR